LALPLLIAAGPAWHGMARIAVQFHAASETHCIVQILLPCAGYLFEYKVTVLFLVNWLQLGMQTIKALSRPPGMACGAVLLGVVLPCLTQVGRDS
jgi:hypothetical protein